MKGETVACIRDKCYLKATPVGNKLAVKFTQTTICYFEGFLEYFNAFDLLFVNLVLNKRNLY